MPMIPLKPVSNQMNKYPSFSIERLVIFNFALFVKVISIYDEKTNTEILKIKKTAIFCSLIV